jgi:hypothetical protein
MACFAQEGPAPRVALQGVKDLAMEISIDEILKDLNVGRIKNELERQLTDAGLQVTDAKVQNKNVDRFIIDVMAVEDSMKIIYGYGVRVELHQRLLLPWNPQISISAISWSKWSVGISGKKKAAAAIREALEEMVGDFVDDYKRSNR